MLNEKQIDSLNDLSLPESVTVKVTEKGEFPMVYTVRGKTSEEAETRAHDAFDKKAKIEVLTDSKKHESKSSKEEPKKVKRA